MKKVVRKKLLVVDVEVGASMLFWYIRLQFLGIGYPEALSTRPFENQLHQTGLLSDKCRLLTIDFPLGHAPPIKFHE